MNEKKLLLKARRAEIKENLAKLEREGSSIIEQLEKGLSLGLHGGKVSNLNAEKIGELSERLTAVCDEIALLKEQLQVIEDEL